MLNQTSAFRKTFEMFESKLSIALGGVEANNGTSVTRFGEISPLWQFLEGLFSFGQNFEHALGK